MPEDDVLILRQKQSRSFGPRDWSGNPLHLLRIASERWGRGTVRPGNRSPHYSYFFVKEGELVWRGRERIAPFTLLRFSPGEPRLLACPARDCTLGIVTFSGPEAPTFAEGHERTLQRIQAKDEIMSLLDHLLREALFARSRDYEACVLWFRLLLLNLSREGGPGAMLPSQSWLRFQAAREKLAVDAEFPANLSAIAAELGMSHAHLCRLFRTHEGMTPQAFVMKRRIQAAADELARGRASVTAVADRFGFSDAFSFSRAFKRIMGEPPSQFAARYR